MVASNRHDGMMEPGRLSKIDQVPNLIANHRRRGGHHVNFFESI
jgi:hypothetical protein